MKSEHLNYFQYYKLIIYFSFIFNMPLIVVCGIPGSGKTTRSNQIAEYLKNKYNCKVSVIN